MTAFGLVVGALLVWKLGTVGVWVGVMLLVIGAFRAWELVQTFLHPPGTIVVTESEVSLPRGLNMSRPVKVKPSDVSAVYFLRRSVPWNRSAPVLVVEVGGRAMAFPRDWFASEADQRHVVHALMKGLGSGDGGGKSQVSLADDSKSALVQLAGGLVLLGAGVVGAVVSRSQTGIAGQYALYVGPIVAGVILAWRGFARW